MFACGWRTIPCLQGLIAFGCAFYSIRAALGLCLTFGTAPLICVFFNRFGGTAIVHGLMRVLGFCGDISMEIYLLFSRCLTIFQTALPALNKTGLPINLAALAAALAGGFILRRLCGLIVRILNGIAKRDPA